MKGRPRKPVEALKLRGTFRKDRHAAREKKPAMAGAPEMPAGLSKDARWLWEMVVAQLADKGILALVDTAHVWSMCELWGLYRAAVAKAKKDPLDKDARISVTSYKAAFDVAASKCGLNPSDRERLKPGGQQPETAQPRVASRARA